MRGVDQLWRPSTSLFGCRVNADPAGPGAVDPTLSWSGRENGAWWDSKTQPACEYVCEPIRCGKPQLITIALINGLSMPYYCAGALGQQGKMVVS